MGRLRTSVLLCRRWGRTRFVFRHVGRSPLSVGVSYTHVDVTGKSLRHLSQIVADAEMVIASSSQA